MVKFRGTVMLAAAAVTAVLASPGGAESDMKKSMLHSAPMTVREGSAYVNPVPTTIGKPGRMGGVLWQMMTGDEVRRPPAAPGPFLPDPALAETPAAEGLRVVWMGHSSVLLDVDGKRFLIDPVWSRRVSPFRSLGPSRFFEPPVKIDDIPRPDGIIISHDHYDHLDEQTVRRLAGSGAMFYVSEGTGELLTEWGVPAKKIREMRWWDECDAGGGVTVAATPARHFSGRGAFRRNRTLWSSWVIRGSRHRVFYSGDTGLFDGLGLIGEAYGPFDLTMIEIGAYHPSWGSIHMGPENAVKAHSMLRGKVLMPVHWGTFQLALHDWDAPVRELLGHAARQGVPLCLPRPGAVYAAPRLEVNSMWWAQGEGDKKAVIGTGGLQPVSTDR